MHVIIESRLDGIFSILLIVWDSDVWRVGFICWTELNELKVSTSTECWFTIIIIHLIVWPLHYTS